MESGEPGKKAQAKPNKGGRRTGESFDDLFHEVEGSAEPVVVSTRGSAEIQQELPAVSAEGAASGSAVPGSTLSHDQFWSPVVPQPEIRRQDPGQDIQSLFDMGVESQIDDSTETELNALGAHDVTEIFSPPRFTEKCKAFGVRITSWIRS